MAVHAIIKNNLQSRKNCAQWVPHQLTEGQKIDRMAACLSHLQRYYIFADLKKDNRGCRFQ